VLSYSSLRIPLNFMLFCVPSFFLTFCYVNCSNFNATFAAFVIFLVFVSFFCGFWKYLQTDLLYFFGFQIFMQLWWPYVFPVQALVFLCYQI
jgi:hypothetical protein